MSESYSGSDGESSYSGNSKKSSYGESSTTSNESSKPYSPKENEKNLSTIKETLKKIEEDTLKYVHINFKETFIKEFRKFIIENEEQVLQYHNVDFFIAKFEESTITPDMKENIVTSLYKYKYEEKAEKSNLKYW